MMQDINPWNVFITAFFTALPIVLGQVFSHLRQMAAVIENTEVTKQKAEETSEKLMSVSKDVKEENKAVAHKADEAVTKAAEAVTNNEKHLGEIKEKVEVVTKALNGEGARAHEEGYQKGLIDGSKILTRVEANTARIDVMEGRMDSYDGRMKHVEENTHAILTMLQAMQAIQPMASSNRIQERQV